MKLWILVSIITIFVTVGIVLYFTISDAMTFPNTVDDNYYTKNENYDILTLKSYSYDENDKNLVTLHKNKDGEITYWIEFRYDQFGNLIESREFTSNGDLIKFQKFDFDQYGNNIKTTAFDHEGNLSSLDTSSLPSNFNSMIRPSVNGLIVSSIELSYDDNKNLIKLQRIFDNGTNSGYFLFDYDEFNNLKEVKMFSRYGLLHAWEEREYDSKGNEIILKASSPTFPYTYVFNSEYDEHGNITKKIESREDGTVIQIFTMDYDESNNQIVLKSVDSTGNLVSLNTMTYDGAGNLLDTKIFDSDISMTSWNKYKYDSDDNLIESKKFDENTSLLYWNKYKYDSNDNLTEIKEFNIEKTFVMEKKQNKNNESNEIAKIVIVSVLPNAINSECREKRDCYSPMDVTINVGDTVKWVNESKYPHMIASGTPFDGPTGEFQSELFRTDETFVITFEESGVYDYFSILNPWTQGTISVK